MKLEKENLEKQFENLPFLLSTKTTASILGISKGTVTKLANEKAIKSTRIGNLIKIPKENLIEFIIESQID